MSTREAAERYAVLHHKEIEAKHACIKASMAYDDASAVAQMGWENVLARSDGLDAVPPRHSLQCLTVIEIDGRWHSPSLIDLWLTRHVVAESSRAIAFPVQQIKAIPDMLEQLDLCRLMMREALKEVARAMPSHGALREDLEHRANEVDSVIAKAGPPDEGIKG